MCGIFGIALGSDAKFTARLFRSTVDRLFHLSESRGREASGFALRTARAIQIQKEPIPASELILLPAYRRLIEEPLQDSSLDSNGRLSVPLALIGHSRLATNGLQGINSNNQPVARYGVVGVHNGIVVNVDELWKRYPDLERKFEVDTEVLVAMIRRFCRDHHSLESAARETFRAIIGSASVGVLLDDVPFMLLGTNTGSLYTLRPQSGQALIFASERHILQRLIEKRELRDLLFPADIAQVKSGEGRIIDLRTLEVKKFRLDVPELAAALELGSQPHVEVIDSADEDERLRDQMRRCTRCILPETMPYLEFDENGVCNYCRDYQRAHYSGLEALRSTVAPYRSKNGEPDCLVAFSGGRDSSYGLHFIKTVLKMNPIAYTYDWGMVNGLARRNQARLVGRLGVEHIVVSADIKKKRENIKKNIEAWLKKPNLGTVPLFMAGDKQFFYYARQVKRQTGVQLVFLSANQYERTNFKTGFCAIKSGNTKALIYEMSLMDRIRLASYYGKEFLSNPSYLNASLVDTSFAFFSYYMMRHENVWIYDYIPWEEDDVNAILKKEYDWEVANDTTTTWRIGDGTAAFYNYIYYTVAGFTENDTFRSNQVREGVITRDVALRRVALENSPRYESIREYCQLVGVDFDQVMGTINAIPKLFRRAPSSSQPKVEGGRSIKQPSTSYSK